MPQVGFTCPDGADITYDRCFKECRTGKRCLPLPLLMAIANQYEVEPDKYHVTELLNPPQVVHLQRTHHYFAPPDKSVWATFGTAWHSVMETQLTRLKESVLGCEPGFYRVPEASWLVQERRIEARFQTKWSEAVMTGRYDLYNPRTKTLSDWKTTTVFGVEKLLAGDYSNVKWVEQQNAYRQYADEDIQHLEIVAVFRDWGQRYADKCNPVEVFDLPIIDVQPQFDNAISTQMEIEHGGVEPRACTKDECWEGWDKKNGCSIRRRCEYYCGGKEVCEQYQTWKDSVS